MLIFLSDDRNFVRPADWIPERFSTRPELILDNGAFVPWTTGMWYLFTATCLLVKFLFLNMLQVDFHV